MQITQALHRAMARQPAAVATKCCARRNTFDQFQDRVTRPAGGLRSVGVRKGDRVGIISQLRPLCRIIHGRSPDHDCRGRSRRSSRQTPAHRADASPPKTGQSRKQSRVNPVQQDAQRASLGSFDDRPTIGAERQAVLTPRNDLLEVDIGPDAPPRHQQQSLRQRMRRTRDRQGPWTPLFASGP